MLMKDSRSAGMVSDFGDAFPSLCIFERRLMLLIPVVSRAEAGSARW